MLPCRTFCVTVPLGRLVMTRRSLGATCTSTQDGGKACSGRPACTHVCPGPASKPCIRPAPISALPMQPFWAAETCRRTGTTMRPPSGRSSATSGARRSGGQEAPTCTLRRQADKQRGCEAEGRPGGS